MLMRPFGVQNYTEVFNSIIIVVSNEIWKGIFDGVEQSRIRKHEFMLQIHINEMIYAYK